MSDDMMCVWADESPTWWALAKGRALYWVVSHAEFVLDVAVGGVALVMALDWVEWVTWTRL